MTEEPENLTLVFMRRLDGKMDALIHDVREVKVRQTETTRLLVSLRRDIVNEEETSARVQAEVDRLRNEIDRIKTRLDLTD